MLGALCCNNNILVLIFKYYKNFQTYNSNLHNYIITSKHPNMSARLTFHDDDGLILKLLEHLVEGPTVVPGNQEVAFELSFFQRHFNVCQIWVLNSKRVDYMICLLKINI